MVIRFHGPILLPCTLNTCLFFAVQGSCWSSSSWTHPGPHPRPREQGTGKGSEPLPVRTLWKFRTPRLVLHWAGISLQTPWVYLQCWYPFRS